jgi:hypothetical protein
MVHLYREARTFFQGQVMPLRAPGSTKS